MKNQAKNFSYDVITLNQEGAEINRKTGKNQCFQENLDNQILLELAFIPSGILWMGCPKTEYNTSANPIHQVKITEFWMGIYPITQAQWRIVANYPQINQSLNPDPSYFKGDNLPVERVSWYETVEVCNRLSSQTGRFYRLPSEAEWEYACRGFKQIKGISHTPFHFGDGISPQFANYNPDHEDNQTQKAIYRQETTPVGSFQVANNFGLCDLHGNVWEWCLDPWHDNYEGSPSDQTPWNYGGQNKNRVLRGGSWSLNAHYCTSAYRDGYSSKLSDYGIGFRVVLDNLNENRL